MSIFAIPILHITLGVVNKTFAELEKKIPCAAEWPASLHLHKESYHGQGYEGNECSKMLSNTHLLYEILASSNALPQGMPFIRVFETYSSVNQLFHEDQVDIRDLEAAVFSFREAWKESQMSLTTKVHIVICHLVDFVKMKGGKNMRLYSAQSHESAHVEFMKTCQKYRVKESSNPNYKNQLFRAICDYNGSHAK